MIYTVTFNPALDYTIALPRLIQGQVNRTEGEWVYPGGKGLNVSIMLRRLGTPSVALGFCAGFTGRELLRLLAKEGCETDFIELPEGNTRINVKIKSAEETDINGQGPRIPEESLSALYRRLDALREGDFLVLSGSVPSSLPPDTYQHILSRLDGRGIRFIVDASGRLLENVLPYRPFLIKPNLQELSELFGTALSSREEVAEKAACLQKRGAENVLVSLAGDGALLLDSEGKLRFSRPPKGEVKNSVGAGDSMVAGFLSGYIASGGDYDRAFRMGLAAGSAAAFSLWLADREQTERLYNKLQESFFAERIAFSE